MSAQNLEEMVNMLTEKEKEYILEVMLSILNLDDYIKKISDSK